MSKNTSNGYSQFVFYVGVLVAIIFLFLFMLDNPDFLKSVMEKYGVIGLFIGSIIANATIFLPLPLDILVALIGATPALIGFESFGLFEIFILSAIIGFGAAIGEMTSYILGLTGVKIIEKASKKEFEKLQKIKLKLEKSGMVFVFLGALTPFPFDLIGIASGIIKYDVWKFFAAAFMGKFFRYFLILIASNMGITIITKIFTG